MVGRKALMKNFETSSYGLIVAFWSTIHAARRQSTNLVAVLAVRSRSRIDEVIA
jgi:hypothetical protein